MSLFAQLKELRQKRKDIADAAGAILTKAAKEKRDLSPEENGEWEKRMKEVDDLKPQIDRTERQVELDRNLSSTETRAAGGGTREPGQPDIAGGDAGDGRPQPTDAERKVTEKRMLRKWMLGGHAALSQEERQLTIQRDAMFRDGNAIESRALSADTVGGTTAGGYTVPTGQPYALEIALKSYGGILQEADYIDTDNGIILPYPTMNDTTHSGELIAENTAVMGASGGASAEDPAFGIVNLGAFMTDSGIVKVPIQLLQDSAFDPEMWMNEALRIRLGRRMNAKATVGAGSTEQKGFVPAATVGVTAASATAVTYGEMLDLKHSVDPAYRAAPSVPKFMFNDTTLKALKKLVDGNQRPLWIAGGVSEGVQNRRPDTFDGDEYTINQDMVSMAAAGKAIAYGDFKKFKIRRVKGIQFVRFGERFMDALQIGFLAFIRWDSNLIDAGTHPLKTLQMAAS